MIVCSCNIISSNDIEDVIVGFLRADPWQLITAGKVYHAMEKRGQCCGCFPGVIDIILRVSERFHREMETPEAEIIPFIAKLREVHQRSESTRSLVNARRARAA